MTRYIYIVVMLCLMQSGYIHAEQKDNVTLSKALANPKFVNLIKRLHNRYSQSTRPSKNPASTSIRFQEGEDLFLSVYLDKHYLADIDGLKSKRDAKLGLTSLFASLDFPINIDITNKSAKGWFISPDNHFDMSWDATSARITINGRKFDLSADQFVANDDDIYVESSSIAQWFGLSFDFSFADLKVNVTPHAPLPIQEKWRRDAQQINKVSGYTQAVLPWRKSGYEGFSAPILDVQINATKASTQSYQTYSVIGSHDLAYLNSHFFITGSNQESVSDIRLDFSKESVEGKLLGPLHLTKFQFGDITPVNDGYSRTAQLTRGLSFTNKPLTRLADNRRINLAGDIQPGWDVELYQNNILIGHQSSSQKGRYEFNDVNLVFGDNQFELIFYGPQGQIKTKKEQYYISKNVVKKGQSDFSVSLVQQGRSLFGYHDDSLAIDKGWLATGTYQYGLSDWLALSAGVSTFYGEDGVDHKYFTLGSNMTLLNSVLLNGVVRLDEQHHSDVDITGRTRIGSSTLNMNYRTEHRLNLVTDKTEQQKRFTLNNSGLIFRRSASSLNYRNEWRHINQGNGVVYDQLSNQLAYNTRSYLLSNQLYWINNKIADQSTHQFTGMARIQKSFGPVLGRLEALYSVTPNASLDKVTSQFYIPINSQWQSQVDVSYFPHTNNYRTNLALNWQKDQFYATANANYDQLGNWYLGLNFQFSLGYNPISGNYFSSRSPLTNNGGLAVRVFDDANANGKYDAGEKLIKNAKVKAVQSYQQAKSDGSGVAILKNLPKNIRTDIVVDKQSLPDPFLVNAIPGISITPREGHIGVFDYPVVQSGELDGVVYAENAKGDSEPATYATIRLVDSKDKVVATTTSEFDGYYLFTNILPGKYKLVIDSDYLLRKKLRAPQNQEVNFAGEGVILDGKDLSLQARQKASGYASRLGEFFSLTILKAYWQILVKKHITMINPQPFYIRNEKSGQYILYAAFYPKQDYAKSICLRFNSKHVSCDVKPFSFDL